MRFKGASSGRFGYEHDVRDECSAAFAKCQCFGDLSIVCMSCVCNACKGVCSGVIMYSPYGRMDAIADLMTADDYKALVDELS